MTGHRGASRLGRDAPNILAYGGHVGAAILLDERHGFAGMLRTFGGMGAMSGPPSYWTSVTASPGCSEHLGVWGPCRGPHLKQAARDSGGRRCRPESGRS